MSSDLDAILKPALLADVYGLMPPLLRLHLANPRGEGVRRLVALRLADVTRRAFPDEALRLLDDLPEGPDPEIDVLQPAVVAAHAWLEGNQLEQARLLVPDLPKGPVRELVMGRVAIAAGDLEGAAEFLDRCLDTLDPEAPLAVEVEAEALGLRARLAMLAQRDSVEDWDRLAKLCEAHGAWLSCTVAGVFRENVRAGTVSSADKFAAVARRMLEARYTRPVEADRQAVAPIPLHVHGAARTHASDPEAYVEAILQIAAMTWRAGDRLDAYETAYYGLRIGERLFGERAGQPLTTFIDGLVAPLSAEELRSLRDAVSERARRS